MEHKNVYYSPESEVFELHLENVILNNSPMEDVTPGEEHDW